MSYHDTNVESISHKFFSQCFLYELMNALKLFWITKDVSSISLKTNGANKLEARLNHRSSIYRCQTG